MVLHTTDRQERHTFPSLTTDTSFEVEEIECDPTKRGYTQVPNYFAYYWTPLLGAKAALTYERICSFAHGKKDTCYPSISLLADILGMDRHSLTGRRRRDSRPGHRQEYYQEGFLQQLVEAGLLGMETRAHPGGRNYYKFTVVKYPPLLSPEQVAKLSPRQQRRHQDLLDDCGKEREERAPLTPAPRERAPVESPTSSPDLAQEAECRRHQQEVPSSPAACDDGTDVNTQRTKTNNTLSPELSAALPSPEDSVKTFYHQIGQPQISRQKLQDGVKIIASLTSQGFNPVAIVWAMTWIATHQDLFGGKVYSLGLLPTAIGQALEARESEERRHAKRAQQAQAEHQLHAELRRREELDRLYQTLSPTEQAALREVAVKGLLDQGVKPQLLLDSVVKCQVYCLLGERHLTPA
ncbi:MAG: hypothetical protein HOP18_10390 [Deltaproteobacteria bacterium]|nr:hypothetical protein [Deltaproteobacteria bacterium]